MATGQSPRTRWSAELGAHRLEVELAVAGVGTEVRLLSDGLEVDRAHAGAESWTTLEGPGLEVRIHWGLLGRPTRITARAAATAAGEAPAGVEFAPPPGSRRARLEAWGARHPGLWAARRPLIAALRLAGAVAIVALVIWILASGLALDLAPIWLPIGALLLIILGVTARARRRGSQSG